MPLTVRHVHPKHLYRKPLPKEVKNELQAVAVYSLAGAIRQISSLAKHAESMLGELCDSLTDINTRTVLLDSRISRLRDSIIPNLDVDEEAEIGLIDYLDTDPFKSEHTINQQLLSIQTAPEALTHQYLSCDPKPDLHKFTPLFDNGCDAMNLYSNPNFFFISWRKSMEKEAMRIKLSEQMASNESQPPPPKPARPRGHRDRSASHSSTLPTRGKSKDKAIPANMQAFSSVRDKKIQRKRSTLRDDTFTRGTEPSESSGYLSSHNSSCTSLYDHDSTGSIGSGHDGRLMTGTPPGGTHPLSNLHISASENTSISSQIQPPGGNDGDSVFNPEMVSLSQPMGMANGKPVMLSKLNDSDQSDDTLKNKMSSSQGSLNSTDSSSGGGSSNRPKVLHRMRSSSRAESRSRDRLFSINTESTKEGVPETRKTSVPLSTFSNPNRSPRRRRETMPLPSVSPGASPEIKRRAEQLITDRSPEITHQRPHSGVFQFPDPLEVISRSSTLLDNDPLELSNEALNKMSGFSPEDFPPIDPQLVEKMGGSANTSPARVPTNQHQGIPNSPHSPNRHYPGVSNSPRSPHRQRHQTVSGIPVARRPAPNPPTNKKVGTPPGQSGSGVIMRHGNKPSPISSPVTTRRHSLLSNDDSPLTPKRKAPPPPPFSGNKATSLDKEITNLKQIEKGLLFEKQLSNDGSVKPSTPTSGTATLESSSSEEKTPTNTPIRTPSQDSCSLTSPKQIMETIDETRSQSLVRPNPTKATKQEDNPLDQLCSHPARRAPSLTKAVIQNSLLDDRVGPKNIPEHQTQHEKMQSKTSTVASNTPKQTRQSHGSASKSHDKHVTSPTQKQPQQRRPSSGSYSPSKSHDRPVTPPPTQKSTQRGRLGSGSKDQPSHIQTHSRVAPSQPQRNRTGSNTASKPKESSTSKQKDLHASTQGSSQQSSSQRGRVASESYTTPSRFSESDKIADMLRAKAKQRKQKSDEKKKSTANQILKGAGVDTTITEERSDLLRAIRKGIHLKNVRNQEELVKKQSSSMPWDVAAILERRQALATPPPLEVDDQGSAVHDNEWDDM